MEIGDVENVVGLQPTTQVIHFEYVRLFKHYSLVHLIQFLIIISKFYVYHLLIIISKYYVYHFLIIISKYYKFQAVDALNSSEVKNCKLYVARAQKKNERQAELREKYEKLKMERLNRYQQGNKEYLLRRDTFY